MPLCRAFGPGEGELRCKSFICSDLRRFKFGRPSLSSLKIRRYGEIAKKECVDRVRTGSMLTGPSRGAGSTESGPRENIGLDISHYGFYT